MTARKKPHALVEFEVVLSRLERAVRGAEDLDIASALMALLFHRLFQMEGTHRQTAMDGIALMLKMTPTHGTTPLTLVEPVRRMQRQRIAH